MQTNGQARRTQAQRRAESEEAILAAAAELIAERGIERATLARIGERAGSSRGLPTHHFGSKDQLVERLAHRAQDEVQKAAVPVVVAAQQSGEKLSSLELIRLAISSYLDGFVRPTPETRSLIVMWGATFPSQTSVHGMHEADLRAYEGWSRMIREGQADGSIRADVDPAAGAVLLHGLTRGVAALLLGADAGKVADLRSTCDAFVTNGLAAFSNGRPRRAEPLRAAADEPRRESV